MHNMLLHMAFAVVIGDPRQFLQSSDCPRSNNACLGLVSPGQRQHGRPLDVFALDKANDFEPVLILANLWRRQMTESSFRLELA